MSIFRLSRLAATAWLASAVFPFLVQEASAQHSASRVARASQSEAIHPALGQLRWGMTKKKVMRIVGQQIERRYRAKAATAKDVIEEDRVFARMREELAQVRDSFVVFRGALTGWDGSFLRDEFRHGSGEAMFQSRDEHSRNYYFFINNRLWKWYRQFTHASMDNQSFTDFARALERRFGPSLALEKPTGRTQTLERWHQWQDDATRLRALKRGGHLSLVFDSKQTLAQLARLRSRAQQRVSNQRHTLVESVLLNEDEASRHARPGSAADPHHDVAGHVTRALVAHSKPKSRKKRR
ncbi:MAG: hypothetical protein MJD61_16070 [Proteobacteria bacterium]|nr:hypothetical protein [Pseudomonadota bacterium]